MYETGLKVVTAGTPIPQREALSPRVKSLNYLAHILAKIEGIQAGADEVLMLDSERQRRRGVGPEHLRGEARCDPSTPAAYAGILKGVTRDVVIELARGAGYEVQETMLNRYDVYTADEAFFTGTASRGDRHPPGGRPAHRHRQAWAGHPRPPVPLPGAGPELSTPAALAVFLHAPRLGTVKPRLAAELGNRHALRLYRIMAARTLAAAREAGLEATVWFTPGDAGPEMRYWLGESCDVRPQASGRSRRAARRRGARGRRGPAWLALLGDCPGLDAALLREAAAIAERGDLVLGPTRRRWLLSHRRRAAPAGCLQRDAVG